MKKLLLLALCATSTIMASAQSYTMKITKNNGETVEIPANEVKEVTFDEQGATPTPTEAKYVEILGTKWATGNLQYDNGTWKIADHQWDYFTYDDIDYEYYQGEKQIDHFNFGTVGNKAINIDADNCARLGLQDISGKLYKDNTLKQETTSFEEAEYGDLPFWATKGQYRLPKRSEIDNLVKKASWQYGKIEIDDQEIYGYLFTQPTGAPEHSTAEQDFTEEDIAKGLFLPCAGSRDEGKRDIRYGHEMGCYWMSQIFKTELEKDIYAYFLQFDYANVVNANGDNARCGNSIRPVLCK